MHVTYINILRLKAIWIVYIFIYFIFFMLCAAVHCERFSGGEDGDYPEEEAGSGGEGFWLHKQ